MAYTPASPQGVALVHERRIDIKLDRTASGSGTFEALVMQRYPCTVNHLPPGISLSCIAIGGRRLISALKYMHGKMLAHLDMKVSVPGHCVRTWSAF